MSEDSTSSESPSPRPAAAAGGAGGEDDAADVSQRVRGESTLGVAPGAGAPGWSVSVVDFDVVESLKDPHAVS